MWTSRCSDNGSTLTGHDPRQTLLTLQENIRSEKVNFNLILRRSCFKSTDSPTGNDLDSTFNKLLSEKFSWKYYYLRIRPKDKNESSIGITMKIVMDQLLMDINIEK